ncbi:MAG: hypothetical protein LUO89_12975 [Methanothrix sp.]|nr:hypothetical protein [Methanothrix sp.]
MGRITEKMIDFPLATDHLIMVILGMRGGENNYLWTSPVDDYQPFLITSMPRIFSINIQ